MCYYYPKPGHLLAHNRRDDVVGTSLKQNVNSAVSKTGGTAFKSKCMLTFPQSGKMCDKTKTVQRNLKRIKECSCVIFNNPPAAATLIPEISLTGTKHQYM